MMISFANLLCVLLTYLIKSLISPGCSYEFMKFMCNEINHSICYITTKYKVYTFNKNKRISLQDIFVYHFLFYIYLFIHSCKSVIIETRTYNIAHDENAMSSSIIQSI